jgi:hypothetical protein
MAINNNNNKNGSRLGRGLPPGMDPSSYWVGGWVGPRAGMDTEDNPLPIPRIETRSYSLVRHYIDWATPAPDYNNKEH